MRNAFIIYHEAGGKRRLASDVDRSPSEERLAFEALKTDGLPPGVEHADYHDSDNPGGLVLTLQRAAPAAVAEPTPEPNVKSRKQKAES